MVLSFRQSTYHVPHTSKCIIHTTGTIRDGDMISVTSPVFSSINYTSGAINTTEAFNVTVRVFTESKIFNNSLKDGECFGTLVCDDDDIFNMYVRLQ